MNAQVEQALDEVERNLTRRKKVGPRLCHGTRRDGNSCEAAPFRPGTVIEGVTVSGDYCRTHDPDIPDSARIQGVQPGAGRKPLPREVDVIREVMEEHIGEVNSELRAIAFHAVRPVVVGNGPSAYVELQPDYPTRLAALREMLDRGYGKPKQSSEVTVVSQSEIDIAIREIEAEIAQAEATIEGTAVEVEQLPAPQQS